MASFVDLIKLLLLFRISFSLECSDKPLQFCDRKLIFVSDAVGLSAIRGRGPGPGFTSTSPAETVLPLINSLTCRASIKSSPASFLAVDKCVVRLRGIF